MCVSQHLRDIGEYLESEQEQGEAEEEGSNSEAEFLVCSPAILAAPRAARRVANVESPTFSIVCIL
jgi:hypothetical protein